MTLPKQKLSLITSEFPPQPGGIGNHSYNLAIQLSDYYDVYVVTDNRSKVGNEEFVFDQKLPFGTKRLKQQSFRVFMYVKRLFAIGKAIRSSKLVIASGKFSLWSVGFFSLFFKRRYIAILHGSEVNFKSFLLRTSINLSLQRFDLLIAVSSFTKSLLKKQSSPVVVIPNGHDPTKWKATTTPLVLKGYPKLITVGRISERKGQHRVIAYLPQLIKKYPNLHYHCVGIPTETPNLLKLANELDVFDHLTFHGSVSDQDLQSMLLSADIFVMLSKATSKGDVEGFGIAILEANALGVPAIGFRGCGIEDAINDGKSGLLISDDSEEELLRAIDLILSNYDDFRNHARDWSHAFEWRNVINHYLECLS